MTTTVTMHIGDVRDVTRRLIEQGDMYDLLVTSPPFLALRSYLPPDHPDKHREIGAEPTPAAFLDTLYGLTADWSQLLPEWASICVELGDTMSGSGGGGGDYLPGGMREGQPGFGGSAERQREGNAAHWRQKAAERDAWPLAKSMCLIPHGYTIGLAYGRNPLTGTPSPAGQWRIRNVICWARPNPPVGSLGKRDPHKRTGDAKFRPATSYITVACRGTGRYFDLDAVRVPGPPENHRSTVASTGKSDRHTLRQENPAGAPPLDWHADDLDGDWLWRLPTQPYHGSHYACVDDQTEALTLRGWKRHDELVDGDVIAAYDATRGVLRWEQATFHRYDFDGDLVAVDQRETVQRLTPNHRTLIRTRDDVEHTIEAADLKPSHRLPVAAPFADGGTVSVGREWAALCGWFCAEGHVPPWSPRERVDLYQSQSANPEHVETIRSLLRAVGAQFSEVRREREWRGRPSIEVTFTIRGAAALRLRVFGKRIPPSVLMWVDDDLRAFMDALIDADGHRRPDGRAAFITKHKADADMFQAIAARLGQRSTISERKDGMYTVTLGSRRWVSLRGTNGASKGTTLEHYTGTVWCPSVPSSFWLARRNGRPFITGNTFPVALPRRMILAMCPQRVCTVCGWPSERINGEPQYVKTQATNNPTERGATPGVNGAGSDPTFVHGRANKIPTTVGWTDCGHDAWRTGRVIDPFGGSGATAVAAALEHRDAVLIDLDERNVDLVDRRLRDTLHVLDMHRTGDTVTWTVDAPLPDQDDQIDGQLTLLDLKATA